MSSSHDLPLQGIRVLDLSRLLPGPLCSLMLADLGADVFKIEAPIGGDYARWFPPMWGQMSGQMSGGFAALNRNKRSVALDLKAPDGVAAFRRLAASADVVLESFRPGVMARLGLDADTLHQDNPGLIYCSISGYGQDGPMAQRAGHDINYLARTGVLSMFGEAASLPSVPGIQIADIAGGSWSGVSHILAALFRRERTGQGACCDIAMTEGLLPFLTMAMGEWSAGAAMPRGGQGPLRGEVPCYRVYRCGDGKGLAVGSLEPKFWAQFLAAIDLPHLSAEGLDTGAAAQRVHEQIEAKLATRTRDQWAAFLAPFDACVEPVLTVEEALHEPQAQARGYFPVMSHETHGPLRVTRSPFRFAQTPDVAASTPPLLGQHSADVLAEFGFSQEEIEGLVASGALLINRDS